MTYPGFPKTFACPVCKSTETISFQAAKAVYPGHAGKTALKGEVIPIKSPGQLSIVPHGLMCQYDICAACGTTYLIHAEIIQGQVQVKSALDRTPTGKLVIDK